jgi:hypothetical protein
MPRGQIYAIKDIPIILKLGTRGERMYLHGLFKVSASGKDRAILRSLKSASNVRVIVQYPQGVEVPSEDSQVHRDARRPFQIIDMRESPDGQINVYAREVTRP